MLTKDVIKRGVYFTSVDDNIPSVLFDYRVIKRGVFLTWMVDCDLYHCIFHAKRRAG